MVLVPPYGESSIAFPSRSTSSLTLVPGFSSEKVRARDAAKDAEEARLKSLYRGQPDKVKAGLEQWEAANPAPRASVQDVADHIDHVVQVAGATHAGLGADLDGISVTPAGLESVADYPKVFAELIHRGYTDEQLKGIAGLNVLRVMRKAEAVANFSHLLEVAKLIRDAFPKVSFVVPTTPATTPVVARLAEEFNRLMEEARSPLPTIQDQAPAACRRDRSRRADR